MRLEHKTNTHSVPSEGKGATSAKRGKMHACQAQIDFGFNFMNTLHSFFSIVRSLECSPTEQNSTVNSSKEKLALVMIYFYLSL